jgi:hypothetical protein
MSWNTSLIFIKQIDAEQLGPVLDGLGVDRDTPGEAVSFEDATSSHAGGKSVGHVDGWTVVCDPVGFASTWTRMPRQNELWSPQVEGVLRAASKISSPMFGFLIWGMEGRFGFSAYHNGRRVRLRLVDRGNVRKDQGRRLAEEAASEEDADVELSEEGLLLLMERVCLPFERLSNAEFQLYPDSQSQRGAATQRSPEPTVDDIPRLLKSLRDANFFTAASSAFQLSRLGAPAAEAIPIMIERLSSDDPNIRAYMAKAIAEFGPLAKEAVPHLLPLLNDKGKFRHADHDNPVWLGVAEAIAKLDPDRPELLSRLNKPGDATP